MIQRGVPLLLKRALDVVVASSALVVAAPIMAAAAGAIALSEGRPILFRQTRPGRHGRPFQVMKFRTMSTETSRQGTPLADGERLTQIGQLLRATSVDELPQLLNVLSGQMSLVGPRPLLMEYLERYTPDQARRHDVLPGITGWTAVNGRNALTWEEKFALDIWYVDHWTPLLDIKILALTVARVLRREGISQRGHETMPIFEGSATTQRQP